MSRARPNIVSVRFDDEELAVMQDSAARAGRSLSDHTRVLALAAEVRARPGVEVRRLSSGAELTTFPTIHQESPCSS